jgi:hypothetical protein
MDRDTAMDAVTRGHWANILSSNRDVQGTAYSYLLNATSEPVDWAYEIWDDLTRALSHKEGRTRSIAAQLLCNLAKSDPEGWILRDFDTLFAVTADPKFVTARHALQATWRIATVGERHRAVVVSALASRFSECTADKNCTLIRYDIAQCLRRLHDAVKDEGIRRTALGLIATEADARYRRKYEALWK